MNSCVLMAEIVEEPQLRYTSDSQMAITEMQVEFPGLRPEDPAARLKVVGWGNLAQDMQSNYHVGDRVVLEGRLGMNTIERPEGFKEKRAEMTVQRIHVLAPGTAFSAAPLPTASLSGGNTRVAESVSQPGPGKVAAFSGAGATESKPKASKKAPAYTPPAEPNNLDDIPF